MSAEVAACLTPGLHLPSAEVTVADVLEAAAGAGVWCGVVPPPATKRDLLDTLAEVLSLPAWFGRNWDALEECLGDLTALPQEARVLVIESVDALAPVDRRVLVELLAGAVLRWSRTATPLSVVLLAD